MNNILDLMKTPKDVNNDIVKRMRARRKEQKLTQACRCKFRFFKKI